MEKKQKLFFNKHLSYALLVFFIFSILLLSYLKQLSTTGYSIYNPGDLLSEEIKFPDQKIPLNTVIEYKIAGIDYVKNVSSFINSEPHEILYNNESILGYETELIIETSDLNISLSPGNYTLVTSLNYKNSTIDSISRQIIVNERENLVNCSICDGSESLPGCNCEEYAKCRELYSESIASSGIDYCLDSYETTVEQPGIPIKNESTNLSVEEINISTTEDQNISREEVPLVCWDCNDANYETADLTCECDEYEKCKDIYHKSTAYEFDVGTYATDYCYDSNTVVEYYIDCYWTDEIFYELIDCPSGYSCSNGACYYTGCDYDPPCSHTSKRTCYTSCYYDKYTASTACYGGCDYTYDASYSCGSGKYCSGTQYDGVFPCYSCSTTCDNYCQCHTCYGFDPDCDSGGGATLICCGDGDCETGENYNNCPADCPAYPDIRVYPTSLTYNP